MSSLHRRAVALVLGTVLTWAALVTSVSPAGAVTFGNAVASPSRSVPWVLSLFYAPDADTDPSFICTSSALSAREVLTAAHCVQDKGFYYVGVGGDSLRGEDLVPVEALRDDEGYSPKRYVDDVAVLRPLQPLGLRSYARVGSAALAKGVRGRRPPALTLYGWGVNQNHVLTGHLLTARLKTQTSSAQKVFGSVFRPGTMIAAGRLIKPSNAYAGACNGDSGGPLVVTVHGVPYVIGITSFGVTGCNVRTPTVFTSTADYGRWITGARKALPHDAVVANRALPASISDPTIEGTVALGQTLTCRPGRWTPNATAFRYVWLRSTDPDVKATLVTKGSTYRVTAADAGATIGCAEIARSQAGVDFAVAVVDAAAAPVSHGAPAISGIDPASVQPPPAGTTVSCAAPAYSQPSVATDYAWFAELPSGRQALGGGAALVLTDEVLNTVSGSTLVCVATSSNAMGQQVLEAGVAVPAPPATP